jgi:glycosyltransferase involved in cell wall biosynthesis
MANQTRQLVRLLELEGAKVSLAQTNRPHRPSWVGKLRGLRALFRLVPYLWELWRIAGRVSLLHVMANSGWSWHLYAAPAILIGRLRNVPVIVNYRGGGAERFLRAWAPFVRPLIRRSAMLVVPSGFLKAVFAKFGLQATVVPNVIDLSRFQAATRSPPATPHLIVTRNLEPVYDVATALRALAIVRESYPDAKMTIAGSGPQQAALLALAHELDLGEAVVFAGRIDNDRIGALYASASTMLNPSLVDNMPISVLEALASGVPVVSTNVGGVPFMVQHDRTALLVPPGDPGAMAQAVLRLVKDPGLAAALSRSGAAEVQQYCWSAVSRRLLDAYAAAVGAQAPAAAFPG